MDDTLDQPQNDELTSTDDADIGTSNDGKHNNSNNSEHGRETPSSGVSTENAIRLGRHARNKDKSPANSGKELTFIYVVFALSYIGICINIGIANGTTYVYISALQRYILYQAMAHTFYRVIYRFSTCCMQM